jgi:hypothetical protein
MKNREEPNNMSKFKHGDVIRVVQVTDIDAELTDPKHVHKDPTDEYTMDWRNPPQTLIGQVGVITQASINDYYDCYVRFPWQAENEDMAMMYNDIVLHPKLGDKVKVTVPYLCRFEGAVVFADVNGVVVRRLDDGAERYWPFSQVEVMR